MACFLVQLFGTLIQLNVVSKNWGYGRMPISYYVFGILLQFAAVLGIRFSYRLVLLMRNMREKQISRESATNVMIIGAGEAGRTVLHELSQADALNNRVCCFIDDNPNKWDRYIEGVTVVGGREDIMTYAKEMKIDQILFAIPRIGAEDKREILNICNETGCELKSLPGLYQLVNGEVHIAAMKAVTIDDLLGRPPIENDMVQVYEFLQGKTVLITGAGGSIGSVASIQVAAHQPKQLILFDMYENNIYDVEHEVKTKYPELDLVVLIGSVRDSRRINQVFETYKPDVVYHAAAHKHVPLMEGSPNEAIKNNAIGTYKTAYAAMMNGCKRFVLISTDKAVNPTNIMGASKRIAEIYVQSLFFHQSKNKDSQHTRFITTRFGNVLGSNGSVIPRFRQQIENGGPVTVTHRDIIRYFMTIPEACQLVLEAGCMGNGGEIYIFDMGKPIKIYDLATRMISLAGLRPGIDIQIVETGLRPGEKLYEELLNDKERTMATTHKKIMIAKVRTYEYSEIEGHLTQLKQRLENNDLYELVMKMKQIIPEYKSQNSKWQEVDTEITSKITNSQYY